MTRGLRQRDPFSSFLFTTTTNVLNRMMLRTEESSLLEGFLLSKNRIKVSHLQFIDETIFFVRASMEDLQNLKLILLIFGNILRLKINLDKNTLFGTNISQDLNTKLASMLNAKFQISL